MIVTIVIVERYREKTYKIKLKKLKSILEVWSSLSVCLDSVYNYARECAKEYGKRLQRRVHPPLCQLTE